MYYNYLEINFEDVKGYKDLTEEEKKLFKNVYKLHNSVIGADYKEGYKPVKVKAEGNKLRVDFTNGEYLYYYKDETWG